MTDKPGARRILFFNVIPLPHSIDLQQQLVQDGYEIDFWYLKDLTAMYPWQVLQKNISYRIYNRSSKHFFAVLKSARQSQLVIITGWHSVMHILLALYCRLTGIPYSFWLDVPEQPAPGFKTSLKQWFMKLANGLFITGKSGIDFFIRVYKASPVKCYDFPYLETTKIDPAIVSINEERNAALLRGDKIRLLLSNRFLQRKGYSTVLAAFKQLTPEEFSQLEITILGTGAEKENYQQEFEALGNNVQLKGWVEYDEYLRILQAADIFIHASTHEPFGIPPMDAMRYGKLVIGSTGVMSCMDRIRDGVNGYLFNAGDHQALATVLSSLVNNRALIYQKGQLAYQTSLQYGYAYNKIAIDALMKSPAAKV